MSTTIKKKSQKQEKQIAKDMNGYTTLASGALWTQKADVRAKDFLIECKITEKTYYSLTTKVWMKIAKEALHDGLRTPIMNIQLRDGKNSIAVIDYHDFLTVIFDVNSINFVGNPIPDMIEAGSYRIKPDFMYENVPQELTDIYYHRHDFKFIDADKKSPIQKDVHLVMLQWSDFLKLLEERDKTTAR